jgi:hypothetical protein
MSLSARSFTRVFGPVLAFGTLLGACSDIYYDRRDTIALSAGDAMAANAAVQTVDPWPPESNDRNIRYNGDKMQVAAARYRTGKVITPRSIVTSPDVAQTKDAPADAAPPQ